MKISTFITSANNPRFESMLEDFSKAIGANIVTGKEYKECDVAVIFGSWKDRNNPWHVVKNNVVKNAKNFIVFETPLIGRGKVEDIMQDDWYRVGLNGFLANTGKFNNHNKPSDRWEKIQKELGVSLKPWKRSGDYIVLALQIPGDASLQGTDISFWARRRLLSIRCQTEMPIILRTPQLKRPYDLKSITKGVRDVTVQEGTKENLVPTLDDAYCTVTYTSGMGVDSVMNGTPTIAYNPGNFAYDISTRFIDSINSIAYPDREQWINNLSYCQWNISEIQEGLPWEHLKEIL